MSLRKIRRDRFPWSKQQAEAALSAELKKSTTATPEPNDTPKPRPLAASELDKYDPSNPLSVLAAQRFLTKLNEGIDNPYIANTVDLLNRSPDKWDAASAKFDKDLFERRLNHSGESLTRSLNSLSFEQLSHLGSVIPPIIKKRKEDHVASKKREIDDFIQAKRMEFNKLGLDENAINGLVDKIRETMLAELIGEKPTTPSSPRSRPSTAKNHTVTTSTGKRTYIKKSKRFGVNYISEDAIPGFSRVAYLTYYKGKPIAWSGTHKIPIAFQLEKAKGNSLVDLKVEERLYFDAKRQSNFLNRNGTYDMILAELEKWNELSK